MTNLLLCILLFAMANLFIVISPKIEPQSTILSTYSRFFGMVMAILACVLMIVLLIRL